MSITLKNHINHADGSRNNKINANTVLCPLLVAQKLSTVDSTISLIEINFKAADKINVVFAIQEGNDTISEQFNDALLNYNEAVRDKTITTTCNALLQHSIVTTEQVDVSQAVIDAMFYVKLNKGGVKGDKFEAEIQFKKTLQITAAAKPAAAATKQANPEQTTTKATVSTTSTSTTTTTTTTTRSPSQHQQQAQVVSQHVLNTLFDRKEPLDFTVFAAVYKAKQDLAQLEHELSLAKNKEKAAIQAQIDVIKAELAKNEGKYNELQQQLQQAVLQDVVTVSNVGYTKGMSSVKKF